MKEGKKEEGRGKKGRIEAQQETAAGCLQPFFPLFPLPYKIFSYTPCP